MTIQKHVQAAVMAAAMAVSLAAQAQSDDPRQFVVARFEAVQRLVRQPVEAGSPQATQRAQQVSRLLNGMIDVEELGRRALDGYWVDRSEPERTEFVTLLRQLIERSYRQHIDQTGSFAVTYEAAQRDDAAGTAAVRSTARSRTDARATPVIIEYRLLRRDGRWVVYDIVTNGSSLVDTYRESYTRIVRDRGFAELLRRLRARVAST